MLPELLQKVSLFRILYQIDADLSKQQQQQRCPYCIGPLHQSNYARKPRGGPKNIPDEYMIRHSLCCGREDCRRRTLPPSCRFMGRRVYWGCVILVVMTLRQNRQDGQLVSRLLEQLEISRKTLKQWIVYFRDEFPTGSWWQGLRGRISPSIGNNELPGRLVHYFLESFQTPAQGLIGCCRFLASG